MDNKKQSFFAPSYMERATKLIICLVILLLLNCGNVFANLNNTITAQELVNKVDAIPETMKDYILNHKEFEKETIEAYTEYDYMSLVVDSDGIVYFLFSNGEITNRSNSTTNSYYNYWYCSTGFTANRYTYGNTYISVGSFPLDTINIVYAFTECGINTRGLVLEAGKEYGGNYLAPLKPYFEFSVNKIGTTTLENVDGNINTYYQNSFRTYSNSYTTFKYIGDLYIPKEYILDNIYMPVLYITKYTLNMTNSWSYKGYDFFKEDENEDYIRYSINIDFFLMTSPYYYNINLKSINEDYEDININFVLINQPTTGGTIVENNSGDIISGEQIKDETTLGDINNTIGSINESINEKYNENESELNNLTSGDILENLGYEITENPNADLWDTIISGLKEVLTGNGEVIFEFQLRKTKHEISSKQITMPQNELKVFISLAVNFYFLIQMFQFIKRTIDQINEGNLKVMHDVDADCYFF